MNPILRNVLAVVAGFVVGSIVNMGIVMGSGAVVPLPPGVDATNMESLKAGMHLLPPWRPYSRWPRSPRCCCRFVPSEKQQPERPAEMDGDEGQEGEQREGREKIHGLVHAHRRQRSAHRYAI